MPEKRPASDLGSNRPWNIFLSHQVVWQKTGYLTGTFYHHANVVCIHENMPLQRNSKLNTIVGFWQKTASDRQPSASFKHNYDFWFTLIGDGHAHASHCSLQIKSHSEGFKLYPVVCIFYEPKDLRSSYVFLHSSTTLNKDFSNLNENFSTLQTFNGLLRVEELEHVKEKEWIMDNPEASQPTNKAEFHSHTDLFNEPQNVLVVLARDVEQRWTCHEIDANVKSFFLLQESSFQEICAMIVKCILLLPFLLMWIVGNTGLVLCKGVAFITAFCSSLPKLLHTPCIFRHLQEQAVRYKTVLILKRNVNFNVFIIYNIYSQQLLDTCLGMSVIFFLIYYGLADQISSLVLDWADECAQELTSLVQWLMGAPAGLKLNAQLTKFMGHFFIYHIYLWTGYLNLLRNVMPSIVWFCSCTGVLGVTVQLCFVQDVLSMLTLHIYCFYVYAAKIFYLQVYSLKSLWRLFRGKKWNVLRSRVDSASYNTDQLFVGTLLFTILLFLLPTTALYYAVFCLLRLVILTCQGLLSRVVAAITSMPVFTLVARLFAPKLVAGSAAFAIFKVPEYENCLILTMQTCQIPLSQLLKFTAPFQSSKPSPTHTWGQFFSHVATGKLIYPWVEAKSEVKQKKLD